MGYGGFGGWCWVVVVDKLIVRFLFRQRKTKSEMEKEESKGKREKRSNKVKEKI